jgi:hypothetical protein
MFSLPFFIYFHSRSLYIFTAVSHMFSLPFLIRFTAVLHMSSLPFFICFHSRSLYVFTAVSHRFHCRSSYVSTAVSPAVSHPCHYCYLRSATQLPHHPPPQEDVDPGLCPWAAIGEACAGVVGVAQAIGSGAGGLDDLRGRLSGTGECCVTFCVYTAGLACIGSLCLSANCVCVCVCVLCEPALPGVCPRCP